MTVTSATARLVARYIFHRPSFRPSTRPASTSVERAWLSPLSLTSTTERVPRLVRERGQHVEFGFDRCGTERGFERPQLVEPAVHVLVTAPAEVVGEVPAEPVRGLCHRIIVESSLK
jgi:hypothetical protein